ncbi:protein CHUP1, chloroplastic isoform X2 [Prosopis cineraria]|uniref:protein CHUP1, chloroplastic isoform X2 n=1 Tax=Prosopis cineraria TaxID=364024 RepID=UPI002410AD63|nr:protein CHUP1, chloroplastic isoform X2 [Prosopis cineraria]
MTKEETESQMKKNLEAQMARNEMLEKENQELRQEVNRLKTQIASLKAHNIERKSILWKKIQNSMDGNNNSDASHENEILPTKHPDLSESAPKKEFRAVKVPVPPPKPASTTLTSSKDEKVMNGSAIMAPPPPPAPPKSLLGLKAVRRVPEVIELYRSLTRKDANMENRGNPNGVMAVAFTRNMIEEIENRSTFLSAIKSDVQKQGEFVNFLIKEVESASFAGISEVERFVKWLDGELSSLVDERSVLKHFPQWPEKKADALREAACSYRDLKSLASEVSSFEDNPREAVGQALKRMQALQDRLERSVSSVERTRESTCKRYRNFHIPWEWMLDTGLIGQMKVSSLRVAKECMKRVTKELVYSEALQEDNLLLQGVKFAFRVHQFAGGFDAEATQVFRELKKIATASNTKL